MIRGISISLLLINFAVIFLSRNSIDYKTMQYIVWINANIIYLVSTGGILNQSYSAGILEQILIQNINLPFFFTMQILKLWLKLGIPLSFLSTFLVFILSNNSTLFYFFLSLFYSTFMIAFISAFINALTISNFHSITSLIIALPIILPVFVTARFINETMNFKIITSMIILNSAIAIIIPFIIYWTIKMTIEEL